MPNPGFNNMEPWEKCKFVQRCLDQQTGQEAHKTPKNGKKREKKTNIFGEMVKKRKNNAYAFAKVSTAMRFELTHPKDNNLAGYRLNHSATLSASLAWVIFGSYSLILCLVSLSRKQL